MLQSQCVKVCRLVLFERSGKAVRGLRGEQDQLEMGADHDWIKSLAAISRKLQRHGTVCPAPRTLMHLRIDHYPCDSLSAQTTPSSARTTPPHRLAPQWHGMHGEHSAVFQESLSNERCGRLLSQGAYESMAASECREPLYTRATSTCGPHG